MCVCVCVCVTYNLVTFTVSSDKPENEAVLSAGVRLIFLFPFQDKKKRKVKGVIYVNDSDSASGGDDPNLCVDERGLPTWKIELKGEAATAGLGVTQSQIMDTGQRCL